MYYFNNIYRERRKKSKKRSIERMKERENERKSELFFSGCSMGCKKPFIGFII